MRINVPMPDANSVAAGQTATFKLPLGRTFHGLELVYSGVTLAQLTEIRVLAGSDVIQRYTGGDFVDSLNQFDGLSAAAGILRLLFDRPAMRLRAGIEMTAIPTGDPNDPNRLSSLTLEVDIDAAAAAPALSLSAIQSDPRPLGLVQRVKQFSHAPGAAGDYEIADLPKGPRYTKFVIKSANVNSVRIERNGFKVWERTAAMNQQIQTDAGKTPQAGLFVIDLAEEGFASEWHETANADDYRLILNMAAAGAAPLVAFSLDAVRQ